MTRKKSSRTSREKSRKAPSRSTSGSPVAPASEAKLQPHQVFATWLLGTVTGKIARFYGAIGLGIAGVLLSVAWTLGPQQEIDARTYARLTARAEARIVERWLAIEWKTSDSWVPDWRNVAKATPCAVLEYDGDWGSTRRAFCGTRFPFNIEYKPHALVELAPGVPFDWARDASGLMVPEIRMSPALKRHLESKPAVDHAFPHIVDAKNALELLQFEMVSPTESAIRGWSAAPVKVALALDPADPSSAIPAGFIVKRGPRSGVWVGALLAGAFGLALWWAGAMTVLFYVPMPARAIMAVLPLLALPWWGDELPKYLARLNADFAEIVEDMLGDVDRLGRLVASAPEDALLAHGERLSWKPGGPPYEDTFGRLKLTPPGTPLASPDLALAVLTAVAGSQVRAWPAAERAVVFEKLLAEKKRSLYGAGFAFLPAASEALVDPRGDPAVRSAARSFLSEWVTQPVLEPYPSQSAFAQRVQLYRELTKVPVPIIANPAGWITERGDGRAAEKAAEKAAAELGKR